MARVQFAWLAIGILVGVAHGFWGTSTDTGASVLAANAVFTALSVTLVMFFWPWAINLKNDAEFNAKDERWQVYRLTTQLFWTVLVGIASTGLAVVQLALPLIANNENIMEPSLAGIIVQAVSVGLTAYQVLLLGQSVFHLYAATFWMPRA
ncbi:hypothetical protein D9V34_05135 [Mycetocola lacteus]|uniref:Uncharacterized protein n=1 Tax=Mycetocola lacteus TaxID=76637 RepID=A0A3L7AYC6_9MICO|nr:hypothetical protein D9V34_05135 [Mycetocola lacteus]